MVDDLLTRFTQVAEAHEGVSVKGKKMPYTAVNGNMFGFLSPEGALCLRFDEARRAALAEGFGTGPVMQYGAVMKGYVALPQGVARDAEALAAHFAESLAFARSLKPKPTKR